MIALKFRNGNGEFISSKNLRNVKVTIYNRSAGGTDILSSGWKGILEDSGERYITIRAEGIITHSSAEDILDKFLFSNRTIECELLFSDSGISRMVMNCFIETYERYCEAGNPDSFNVSLISSNTVSYHRK